MRSKCSGGETQGEENKSTSTGTCPMYLLLRGYFCNISFKGPRSTESCSSYAPSSKLIRFSFLYYNHVPSPGLHLCCFCCRCSVPGQPSSTCYVSLNLKSVGTETIKDLTLWLSGNGPTTLPGIKGQQAIWVGAGPDAITSRFGATSRKDAGEIRQSLLILFEYLGRTPIAYLSLPPFRCNTGSTLVDFVC